MNEYPSKLKEVFKKLTSGYHFCSKDGDEFYDLEGNIEVYRDIFLNLGYQLNSNTTGVYYFEGGDVAVKSENAKKDFAFLIVLYESLANEDKDAQSSIEDDYFPVKDLPHLNDTYKDLMSKVGVDSEVGVKKIYDRLKKRGFLLVEGGDSGEIIKFKKTITRFNDIFREASEMNVVEVK